MALDVEIVRGPESWTFFYIALGFALAIEGTIIQMISPLMFPWNLITYLVLMVITGWLFIFNGWFQNKLIGLQIKYESEAR